MRVRIQETARFIKDETDNKEKSSTKNLLMRCKKKIQSEQSNLKKNANEETMKEKKHNAFAKVYFKSCS